MSYNSTDVMVYVYDGVAYCPDCVDESEVETDENWGVIFVDEFFENGCARYCCGTCGHNLACHHKMMNEGWDECPGCNNDVEEKS